MATTIKVRANQSMLDVVLMATGSMEAAMQFCSDNGVSITATPVAGTVYQVSDAAIAGAGDAGAAFLKKINKKGIVIGTLSVDPPPPPVGGTPLGLTVVLRPCVEGFAHGSYVPSSGTPNSFDLAPVGAFININRITAYSSGTAANWINITRWGLDTPGTLTETTGSGPTPVISLNYVIPYSGVAVYRKYAWFHNNTSVGWEAPDGIVFRDSLANKAKFGPIVVMDVASNTVIGTMYPFFDVTLLSSTATTARLQLARAHAGRTLPPPMYPLDPNTISQTWNLPVGLTAIPTSNPDIIYVDVAAGTYNFGLEATYTLLDGTVTMPAISESVVTVA